MLGGDTYGNSGPFASLYNTVKGLAPSPTMPMALHECGTPPDPSAALSQNCMWAWFMVWDGSYIRGVSTTLLKSIYSNSVAITRDKLPNFATAVNYDLVTEKKTLDFEVRKTSEGFTFLAPFAGVNKISLFDVQGRIMTSAAATLTGANQYSVSIPGLSKGAYMVKVEGQGRAADKKIMIGH
jgi:hypothetical protein